MSENDTQEINDKPEGAASCPERLWWVLRNQNAILALHSSSEYSKTFPMDCSCCKLFYQHCMFSNNERKSDYTMCRWCQTTTEHITPDQFDIHRHIHCNVLGKKRCGVYTTMEPPKPKPEVRLADVAPVPEVEFVVRKKMSQKERKAAQRAAAEQTGF